MIDFDRLLELLEKAERGAECDCRTTTMAYLSMAQRESFDMANETETPEERRRFLAAARYVERKVLTFDSFGDAAHFALAFWRGFENGWEEHTMPGRTSNVFKIGRKFATSNA